MKSRPKDWRPHSMTICVRDIVKGKPIEAEADIPLLADGTIYKEMLDKRFDDIKHSLWSQMQREKGSD